jgi:hypothetical protein
VFGYLHDVSHDSLVRHETMAGLIEMTTGEFSNQRLSLFPNVDAQIRPME